MPVSGFSVSHSAGPHVWCIKAVCGRHRLWQASFVIVIIVIIIMIIIIFIIIIYERRLHVVYKITQDVCHYL